MSTCYSAPSRFLLRGVPDYSANTESDEAHEQLRVKHLPRSLRGGLRWIRTRNPPAARHRTYPYTTEPHNVISVINNSVVSLILLQLLLLSLLNLVLSSATLSVLCALFYCKWHSHKLAQTAHCVAFPDTEAYIYIACAYNAIVKEPAAITAASITIVLRLEMHRFATAIVNSLRLHCDCNPISFSSICENMMDKIFMQTNIQFLLWFSRRTNEKLFKKNVSSKFLITLNEWTEVDAIKCLRQLLFLFSWRLS